MLTHEMVEERVDVGRPKNLFVSKAISGQPGQGVPDSVVDPTKLGQIGELRAELVPHEGPYLADGVLSGESPSEFGIEVLQQGGSRLADDGEPVAEHEHTDRQPPEVGGHGL